MRQVDLSMKYIMCCIDAYIKRTSIITCILFIAAMAAFFSPAALYARDGTVPDIAPEDSSWIYVYGGYGYYEWKMMSMTGYLSIFGMGDEISGIDFKHDAEPFVVKKYGVKANLFILSLGLDYLSDKFSFRTDFDNKRELQEDNDRRSDQLKFLSGLKLGSWMFSATALFRDFNSVITSRGYKDSSGGVSDIYYYTEKDGLDYFSPGEKTSFYTLFSEYEFKIEHNLGWSLVGFGFKYKKAGSPMVVDLSYEGVSDSHDGSILMYTENRSYELLISSKYLSRIWGDLYWQYYVPVSIAFMNVSENSYFKKRSYPLGASSVGSIALTYLLSHLKIEAGVDYAMYWSMLMLQDVKLKEGITFLDKFDGSTVTVPAGSKMDMNLSRLEFFWGFYVNAAVYF